jgi:hypothetical protein
MKNIHVLPTDKPSRLHFDSELFISPKIQLSKSINSIVEGRNIYITNDEEIKEGIAEWGFDLYENKIFFPVNNWKGLTKGRYKKIILTTDQDLIKDGVQEINDYFLEWFIKNPSCEFVELDVDLSKHNGQFQTKYGWKIIIPQEEPKQETLKEAAENYGWRIKRNTFFDVVKANELAESAQQDFIEGANWQQERRYSEEEVRKAIQETITLMRYKATEFREHEHTIIEQFKKK